MKHIKLYFNTWACPFCDYRLSPYNYNYLSNSIYEKEKCPKCKEKKISDYIYIKSRPSIKYKQ